MLYTWVYYNDNDNKYSNNKNRTMIIQGMCGFKLFWKVNDINMLQLEVQNGLIYLYHSIKITSHLVVESLCMYIAGTHVM